MTTTNDELTEYRADLKKLCDLVHDAILDEQRKNDARNRAILRRRKPVPKDKPEGLCILNIANNCNAKARHWRWSEEQRKWLPTCRSHAHG